MELQFTLDTMMDVAKKICTTYPNQKIFAMHGQMGAGKTTFISALCKVLGVAEATSSPTYGIIAEYKGFYNNANVSICHMDWYRLKDAAEAFDAGVLDYLQNQNNYCFIEWPSVAPSLLPNNTMHLHIEIISETKRVIHIK